MIELINLSLSQNKTKILQNINISFNEGEVIGIIGESGAGKTAFLKSLAGLTKKHTGDITLRNKALSSYSKKEIQQYISYIFNETQSNDNDIVFDFLLLSRMPYKKSLNPLTELDMQITEKYISLFDLSKHRDKKMLTLSDGAIKKVLLAFSFIREADVLILDNPTNNLDIRAVSLLQKTISRYVMDGNRVIVMASNDLNFIIQTVDKIILLKEGEITFEAKPETVESELIKKYFHIDVILSKNVYSGKPELHPFPTN